MPSMNSIPTRLSDPVLRVMVPVLLGFLFLGAAGGAQASMRIYIEDVAGSVISCDVDGLTQNASGDLTVTNPAPGCLDAVEDNPVNDNKLVLGSKGCGFSALRIDGAGRVTVTASNACVIPQPVYFTLMDDDFSMDCETDVLSLNGTGVLSLEGSVCAQAVKEGDVAGSTLVFRDGPIARGCDFRRMSMDAAGNIVVTAQGSCFGDSDGDLIPDPLDPDNAAMATEDCIVAGDANWETVSISGARYLQDVTCQLPKPEYIVVADVVFGGFHHEPLSYPPDQPIVADYHATNSIRLVGPVSVKGGSSFTVDSGGGLGIWGPFKVTAESEFRVVPLVRVHED